MRSFVLTPFSYVLCLYYILSFAFFQDFFTFCPKNHYLVIRKSVTVQTKQVEKRTMLLY